jgi:hypothetical protein
MKIAVLCITSYSDRPEAETFIGLRKAGVDIEVMCPSSTPHNVRLKEGGGAGHRPFTQRPCRFCRHTYHPRQVERQAL